MDEADGVVVIADESTDNEAEWCVFNILLKPINVEESGGKLVSYIDDQMFKDELIHKIIAKEVIRVVDK